MNWLPFLGLTALALVLLKAAFDVAGQFQAQRDLAQQEVRRLTALVESRTQQLGLWMTRAFDAGWTPELTEPQARRVLRDLFGVARPLGACPSTVEDAARERAWRERRAVSSRDHTVRHFAEGVTPSEWARECLTFCIGGLETTEGE